MRFDKESPAPFGSAWLGSVLGRSPLWLGSALNRLCLARSTWLGSLGSPRIATRLGPAWLGLAPLGSPRLGAAKEMLGRKNAVAIAGENPMEAYVFFVIVRMVGPFVGKHSSHPSHKLKISPGAFVFRKRCGASASARSCCEPGSHCLRIHRKFIRFFQQCLGICYGEFMEQICLKAPGNYSASF